MNREWDRPTEREQAQGPTGHRPGETVPDFGAARRHVIAETVRLARRLRRRGVAVPQSASVDATRALAAVGLGDRDRVASALRATLLGTGADIEAFEAEFPGYWLRLRAGLEGIAVAATGDIEGRGGRPGTEPPTDPEPDQALDVTDPPAQEGEAAPQTGTRPDIMLSTGQREATASTPTGRAEGAIRRYSPDGRREAIDVTAGRLTTRERRQVERFVAALAGLPGRRDRTAAHGRRIDLARTVRASLETGGTPIALPKRTPRRSELRCCLLVDVSGSVLDAIDRSTLVAVVAALGRAARRARTFLFDSELREVTAALDGARDEPAAALRAAAGSWGGGTRIGHAFSAIRERAPTAVDRRTVVVIVSDGLDVGDEETLRAGIAWLRRRAGAIVWLNPLAVAPAYEPTAAGMSTCLPYLDGLFGFVGPADLGAAADQIDRLGLDGPVGLPYHGGRAPGEGRP